MSPPCNGPYDRPASSGPLPGSHMLATLAASIQCVTTDDDCTNYGRSRLDRGIGMLVLRAYEFMSMPE
jgi:hypothetical protein